MARELGVYVHFPWCRSLCPYCDFPVAVARQGGIPHQAYLDAVLAELAERAGDFGGRDLVSVYFGGGTPSLWPTACLDRVISAVEAAFGARRGALEITLEANPTDCTAALLCEWRTAGIDRLSIGVQSMETRALVALGRDHRMGHGAAALAAAVDAGFERISADVIFGTPGVTSPGPPAPPDPGDSDSDEPDPSVLRVADTGVGHMSVYELTIEERTAFGRAARRGTLIPVDEDRLARMYLAIHQALTARGYEHYEISSYARPGQRAVHNQLYWRGGEYLGLGNGAASFRRLAGGAAERTANQRSVKRYMSSRGPARVAERDWLDPADLAAELAWLGMRTSDGVPAHTLAPDLRAWLTEHGLAAPRDGRMCPTPKGFLYADRIAARVVAGVCESGYTRE